MALFAVLQARYPPDEALPQLPVAYVEATERHDLRWGWRWRCCISQDGGSLEKPDADIAKRLNARRKIDRRDNLELYCCI